MTKPITIVIAGKNSFFNYGLKHLLINYFSQHGYTIQFSRGPARNISLNLAFYPTLLNRKGHYCRLKTEASNSNILYFSVTHRHTLSMEEKNSCQLEAGTIHYDDTPESVYRLLDKVWLLRSHTPALDQKCPQCDASRLTPREKQVMNYLCTGISQSQVAKEMQLSVKTVNAHKQSLMRKMDLKKKQDFIYWLIKRQKNMCYYTD